MTEASRGYARAPARRQSALALLAILGPAFLAAILGGVDLSSRSLWIDESATFAIASQHGAALLAGMRRDGGNMLAFYALEHVLIEWFGHSTLVMRLPSVVAAAFTAAATAAIGCRLVNLRTGALAGVLTALSLPYVYWSQDARAYSMMFAFAVLSYLAFIALVEGEGDRPPRWAAPVYAAALIAASYMSFVALLVIPAQLLSLYWYRRRYRYVVSALVVAGVCDIPLLLLSLGRGAGQLFWVPRPSFSGTGEIAEAVLGVGFPPDFHLAATGIPLLVATIAGLAIAGVAAWRRSRQPDGGCSRNRWAVALVASWLLVPTLLDAVESLVGQSVYQSRYLLISAPAAAIALAWGLCETNIRRVVAGSLLVALVALRLWQIVPSYGVSPENWRSATNYVLTNDRSTDCVAFYPSDGRQAVDYYILQAPRPDLPRPILPAEPFSEVRVYTEDYRTLSRHAVDVVATRCPRLWLVTSHVGVPSSSPLSRHHFEAYRHLVNVLQERYGAVFYKRFGYSSPIVVRLYSYSPVLARLSRLARGIGSSI